MRKIKIVCINVVIFCLFLNLCGCEMNEGWKTVNGNGLPTIIVKRLKTKKEMNDNLRKIDTYLKKYPLDVSVLNKKGYILNKMEKYEDALIPLLKAHELDPNNDQVLNNISWSYNNKCLYKLSNMYINKALDILPNDAFEYVNKGNALHGLGKRDKAIKYYNMARKDDPDMASAYFGKGLCYYEKKVYKKSIENFKRYKELNPEGKDCDYYIVSSYKALKDYKGALNEYKLQLKSDPKNEYKYIQIGDLYMEMKDYKNSINYFDIAIKKNPKCAEAFYDKSICMGKMRNRVQSLSNLKKAIELDSEYRYYIGDDFDLYKSDPEFIKLQQ